jgi:hypothetical protein
MNFAALLQYACHVVNQVKLGLEVHFRQELVALKPSMGPSFIFQIGER